MVANISFHNEQINDIFLSLNSFIFARFNIILLYNCLRGVHFHATKIYLAYTHNLAFDHTMVHVVIYMFTYTYI